MAAKNSVMNDKLAWLTLVFSAVVGALTVGTYISTAGENVKQIEINTKDIEKNGRAIEAFPEKIDKMMMQQQRWHEATNERIDKLFLNRHSLLPGDASTLVSDEPPAPSTN